MVLNVVVSQLGSPSGVPLGTLPMLSASQPSRTPASKPMTICVEKEGHAMRRFFSVEVVDLRTPVSRTSGGLTITNQVRINLCA